MSTLNFLGITFLVFGYLTTTCFGLCNVTLHATTQPQNFTSPNYPENYNNNDYCFWDVVPSTPSYNIVLDMVYSNIAGGCSNDRLLIYNTTANRGIRTICGTNRWLMNIGGRGPVRVIFITDHSLAKSGFLIRYFETPASSTCGGNLTATPTEQMFNSPGFPNTYYLDQSCTWIITTENRSDLILLDTVTSDIEVTRSNLCTYDYVTVSNGESGSVLGTFCGNDLPVFVSGGAVLKVHFVSDRSTNRKGFQMKFKSIPVSSCNARFPASKHKLAIVSPGYPGNYLNNLNCTWTIEATNPQGQLSMQVNIVNIDVVGGSSNCSQDRINFNSIYKNGTQIGDTVCNNDSAQLRHSTDGNMTVTFITDNTRVGRGFKLLYQMTSIQGSCGQSSLTALNYNQYLTSPNFPRPYNNNGNCSWTIRASSSNSRVRMVTVMSELGTSYMASGCSDYVDVHDGISTSSPMLGRWCGLSKPNYVSSGRYMTIVFHSDSISQHSGFKIAYREVNGPAPGCGSHTLIASSSTKQFSSPGYPYNYQNKMTCQWTIQALVGRVRVDVLNTNIETDRDQHCSYDYLTFKDGVGSSSHELGKVCGSRTATFYSTGNYMTISFITDNSIVDRGFQIKYVAVDSINCGTTNLLASTYSQGALHSPGYPDNYPNSMDCQWTISAPDEYSVTVDILSLHLEQSLSCTRDYLKISEGPVSSPTQLCGDLYSTTRSHFTSSGRSMVITFHSNSANTKSGFHLQYTAVQSTACKRNLEVNHLTTEYISSPNYPNNYGDNEDCEWCIHASYPYVVDMDVHMSYVESSFTCMFDSLEAFDGQDATAKSLGRWCGSSSPDIHSSGQYMFVKFHTDDSDTGAGFRLSFTAKRLSDFTKTSHVNVGGIIGGIVGALVLLALVACCVSTTRKRSNSTTNSNRNNVNIGRRITCRRHATNLNDIYSITSGNYPMSAPPQPASFMPPPAYSEVVKDAPPSYAESLAASEQQSITQRATNAVSGGAAICQGIDNPVGPQHEDESRS